MQASISQSIRVGLFVIFGVALTWIVWESLSDSRFMRGNGYTVVATFPDLRQLRVNDDVRMAGVRIGAVQSTGLENRRAYAVLYIDAGIEIPGDSVATIATAGLLGSNYISIQPGESGTMLAAGAPIATAVTPDFNDLIAQLGEVGEKVDKLFSQFDSEGGMFGDAGKLFDNLNSLVEENRSSISSTIGNLNRISTEIAEGRGTLGKLISDDAAYETLIGAATEVRSAAQQVNAFAGDARGLVDDIKEGKGPLGVLLNDEAAAEQLRRTIANIESFTARLNDPDNTIGRILANDELYVKAMEALDKVDGALGSLDDSGPITAVGVVAGALF